MSRNVESALRDLMQQNGANVVQKPLDPRGAAPPVTAAAPMPGAGGGGGLASPLTEVTWESRQWWPPSLAFTTDGIFGGRVIPVKQMSFTDANNEPLVQNFAQPPDET